MAQEEMFGWRDPSYSAWHRRGSVKRFVGIEAAQTLSMIDIDNTVYCEYDDGDKEPLAIIETARDTGQSGKAASVAKRLAQKAGIPGFVVLYKLSDVLCNPASPKLRDIESFRVQMLHPRPSNWITFTPARWAQFLVKLRTTEAATVDRVWQQFVTPPSGRLF